MEFEPPSGLVDAAGPWPGDTGPPTVIEGTSPVRRAPIVRAVVDGDRCRA